MFVIESYLIAVFFCIVTMLCWGSWSNTQKLVSTNWRFELYCWDFVNGIVLAALIFALTLGSYGDHGRSFIEDIRQSDSNSIWSAILGGVLFNAANILFTAAISFAGMSVAFSVGAGLSLVLGVIVNFLDSPVGNIMLLFPGVALIVIAILLNAHAYRKMAAGATTISTKGLLLSICSGLLMGLYYKYVANSMFPDPLTPLAGMLSPYTAICFFSGGVLLSNLVLNPLMMVKPFSGPRVSFSAYFEGSRKDHFFGVVGGLVWCIGMLFSIIASYKAGAAISYGLASGAIVVASIWGIFVWKEFKDAPKGTQAMLNVMLVCFFVGLLMIVFAR
ncbi:glucose uptake protein [Dyadobacter sp. BE34]|uniref:Glucose uptake protein n=1 Tax=Dyadobacter fermentans TaxID=94254 RepID=A0ABU1R0C5_9BACT|nr:MULTISPECIES: GRP family sugar transporter [Dyadobacter]MDR6806864.1 glucose uptake protein [Dyadobacter fermentans]MDR7044606.1 glucose uptake protein [Dyadobacter sp. BE242]MDR7198916.1 glucose uptake protein [Dyadobacter sp. BE34]MDR7216878.1 glucose uptake protein [Dyadobacter sp. BE31]MDR7263596.1 glucose uptake protein [Dyadobacter sp. BE32]